MKAWAYKCLDGKSYLGLHATRKKACSWTAESPDSKRIVRVRITELAAQAEGEIKTMSTGIYIRVQRDGKGQSLELEQCTKTELVTFFEAKDNPQELRNWLYLLVGYAAGSAEIIRGLEDEAKRLRQENMDHAESWALLGIPHVSQLTKILIQQDEIQKLRRQLAELLNTKTSAPGPANPPAPQSPPPAPADTADSQ